MSILNYQLVHITSIVLHVVKCVRLIGSGIITSSAIMNELKYDPALLI